MIATEAVTPGEFKSKGGLADLTMGVMPTPFGDCLLAATDSGICKLTFVGEEGWATALDELRYQWAGAVLVQDTTCTQPLLDLIFPPVSARGTQG